MPSVPTISEVIALTLEEVAKAADETAKGYDNWQFSSFANSLRSQANELRLRTMWQLNEKISLPPSSPGH